MLQSQKLKPLNWNPEKNKKLIEERGVSFEDVVFFLRSGGLIDDNTQQKSNQAISRG